MHKTILTSFVVVAFLLSFIPLFTQSSITSPNISIRGNNLARYGQKFLLYCIINQKKHDNINITVSVLDTTNNIVGGLIPLWGQNLILDSLQLKSEIPFKLNNGRTFFSFEWESQYDTSDYKVRIVASSKLNPNVTSFDWIDSTEYIVKTSSQDVTEIKVNQSMYADVEVFYFGDLNEEVTTTFNNAIENITNVEANIKNVEIFGINGTSDTVFTLISPKTDTPFVIPAWQKIPLVIRFKPDTLQLEPFSAVVFVNTENSIGKLQTFTIDGYINTINPSVYEKYTNFHISPNPVLSTATITIPTREELSSENELEVIVNDLLGNVVFSKKIVPSIMEQKISYIPKNSGTYSVTLKNTNEILSTKFFHVLK